MAKKQETKTNTPKKKTTEKEAPEKKTRKASNAGKTGTKKTAPKKTTGKTPAPKQKKTSAPEKTGQQDYLLEMEPQEGYVPPKPRFGRTIAQRTTDWKRGKTAFILRWIAMIPLAFVWYVFTFLMAGYSFSALVCLGLIGILLFYNICHMAKTKYPRLIRVVKAVFTVCLCAGLAVAAVTECLIIHASLGDRNERCEYMVVLGAKVRTDGPSVSLMDRIRAAAEYMERNPEVIAIVSGGQGPDEPMTEARCMYEQLVKLGIDPDRIWMEERATSTWENLNFALEMIEEKTGQRPEKLGLLSSEYHLFRAGLFADACGVDAVGIPANTSRLSQKVNHFMREIAGVWHYIILGGQYSD